MAFSLTDETEKAVVFVVIDIIMVTLFTYAWFKYIEKRKNPIKESLDFVIAMQIFFFIYYFIFDYFWFRYNGS